MPFLELTLPCTELQQPRYERALEDVGALAVTLADAHADAPDEQAIWFFAVPLMAVSECRPKAIYCL